MRCIVRVIVFSALAFFWSGEGLMAEQPEVSSNKNISALAKGSARHTSQGLMSADGDADYPLEDFFGEVERIKLTKAEPVDENTDRLSVIRRDGRFPALQAVQGHTPNLP